MKTRLKGSWQWAVGLKLGFELGIRIRAYDGRSYSVNSLTLNEWRFNMIEPGLPLSVNTVFEKVEGELRYDINPPAIQKPQKLRLNFR